MKNLVLLTLVSLLLLSCNQDIVQKPENLIPQDKMVDIFYDVTILNAAKGSDKRILERNNVTPQAYIYDKYNIDSLQLAESSIYYASRPDEQLKIYQQVQERLTKLKEDVNEQEKQRNQKLRDEQLSRIKDTTKRKPVKPVQ